MLFVVIGWLVVLNLILEFMFASEIQYETTKIHSRHPPLHFPKDLLQHLLLSSWEHSLHFYLEGHITVHCLRTACYLVLINQLLPEQNTAFTPVCSLDLAFAHPLLLRRSVLPHSIHVWEHWQSHCLCWHSKWWMLFFPRFSFFTSNWLIFYICLLQFRASYHFNHLTLSSVPAVDSTEVLAAEPPSSSPCNLDGPPSGERLPLHVLCEMTSVGTFPS